MIIIPNKCMKSYSSLDATACTHWCILMFAIMIIVINESVNDPLMKNKAMPKEVDLSAKNVNSVAIEQEHMSL